MKCSKCGAEMINGRCPECLMSVCEYGYNCPYHPNGYGCCSKRFIDMKEACDHFQKMKGDTMSIQCVFCHRIDLGNRWVYEKPEGTITYVACPKCLEEERRKYEQRRTIPQDEDP